MNDIELTAITPVRGTVLVHNIEQGEKRTRHGIIITDDDGKERGIRERWAQVYAKHPDVEEISVGQWILIKHGRWTRGINVVDQLGNRTTLRKVDWPEAVLLVSDDCPIDDA